MKSSGFVTTRRDCGCLEDGELAATLAGHVVFDNLGVRHTVSSGETPEPPALAAVGQPVLIGGTMGTASCVLVGTGENERRSFGSSCHGAGRAISRHEALRQYRGRQVIDELARRGVIVRSRSSRGVAEEAPGAYNDVTEVVDAADRAGLSKKVARLEPLICIKG
jgi:tRNA-splicing ligase RtcB (3'-phosphate/5'-hydroxy nucleic acid ligase)